MVKLRDLSRLLELYRSASEAERVEFREGIIRRRNYTKSLEEELNRLRKLRDEE